MSPQVSHILIVDNSSGDLVGDWVEEVASGSIDIMCQYRNTGVAQAINIGIREAKKLGATHIMLFDQDSLPSYNMVKILSKVIYEKEEQGINVAAVGPRYTDARINNPPPFIQIKGLMLVRSTCTKNSVVPVDYLISSGCMISMKVLDVVGVMNPSLFIDYVDIEWGLRAKHKGYQSYGVCDAFMEHDLGEEPLNLFKHKFPIRDPLRHYYQFRNAIRLYREPWIPYAWKVVDGSRLFLKYIIYTIFAKPRFKHWKMMTIGFWHGCLRITGRYKIE